MESCVAKRHWYFHFFILFSLILSQGDLHATIDPNACKGSCPGTDLCCTNNASLSCQSESTCKTPKGTGTGVCIKKCPEASGGCTQDSECNGTNKCYQGQCVICVQTSDCQVAGTICSNNQCVDDPNTCTPSCPANYLCINNACVEQKECSQESDCSSKGLHCIGSKCLLCSDQYPCASGFLCQGGQCVDDPNSCNPPICTSNEQCQSGQCVPISTTTPTTPGGTTTFCDMGNNQCPAGMVCDNWQCVAKKNGNPGPGDWKRFGFGKDPMFQRQWTDTLGKRFQREDLRNVRVNARTGHQSSCDPELTISIGETPLSYDNKNLLWLKISYQAPCASRAHLWGPFILFDEQKNILMKPQQNPDPEKLGTIGTKWQADQTNPSSQPCSLKGDNCYGYKTAKPDAFGYDFSSVYHYAETAEQGKAFTKDDIFANRRVDVPADAGDKTPNQTKTVYALFAPFSPKTPDINDPGRTPRIRLAVLQNDGWKMVEKSIVPPPPAVACEVIPDLASRGYVVHFAAQDSSSHYLTLQTTKNVVTYVDLPVSTWCTKELDKGHISGTHWEETYTCPNLLLQAAQTIGCGATGLNLENFANIKRELKLTKPELSLEFYKAANPSSDGTCTQFKDGNIEQNSTGIESTTLDACTEVAFNYTVKRGLEVKNLGAWGDESLKINLQDKEFKNPYLNIQTNGVSLPYVLAAAIRTGKRHYDTTNTYFGGPKISLTLEQLSKTGSTNPGLVIVPHSYQAYRYQLQAWDFPLTPSLLVEQDPAKLWGQISQSNPKFAETVTGYHYLSGIKTMDYPFSFKAEVTSPPVVDCKTSEGAAFCTCWDWICDAGGCGGWTHPKIIEQQNPTYQLKTTSKHAKEIKAFCYNSKGTSAPPMPLSAYKTEQIVTFNGTGADGNQKCTLQVTYQDDSTMSDCLILPNATYSASCSGIPIPSGSQPPTCP